MAGYPHLQIDPKMKIPIQRYGCIWKCCIAVGELVCDYKYSEQETNSMWETNIDLGFLKQINKAKGDADYYVVNPDGIMNYSLKRLGNTKVKANLVACTSWDPEWDTWGRPPNMPGDIGLSFLCGRTTYGNTHYRLGDAEGTEIFDPDPRCIIVRELKIDWVKLTVL